MRIEILSEDKSGAVVVNCLTRQIADSLSCDAQIFVRPHRGCGSLPKDPYVKPAEYTGSLLDLLPAKCRAYNKVYRGTDTILVAVMDSDEKDPVELRRELYDVMRRFAPDIRDVVGICTEETEAWMLGDHRALRMAYPDLNEDELYSYEQDSVCGTWEKLCKVVEGESAGDLIDIGYPAIGHYKAKWAENISRFMTIEDNVSPSFLLYRNSIEAAIRKPGPIPGMHRRTF